MNTTMVLRYTVESKHRKSFTASTKVVGKEDAEKRVVSLMKVNKCEGYRKYSNFKLYDKDNRIIEDYNP